MSKSNKDDKKNIVNSVKDAAKDVDWKGIHRGYRYSAELTGSQRNLSDLLRVDEPGGTEILGRAVGEGKNMLTSYLRNKKK